MERPLMNCNSNTVDNNYSVIKYCSVYKSDGYVTFVEEDGRIVIFQKNKCKISVSYTHKLDSDSKFLFKSYGIIGSISFLNHIYLLVATEARKCGRLFHDHDVYSLKDHKIIPLFHPVHLSQKEREFLRVFNEFDISNNFYFSYTYNLSNSLRLNLSLKSLFSNGNNVLGVENELLMFDPVLTGQKYCYNFNHKSDLCQINENCFSLSLNLIHGYFTEFAINVTGRNLVFTLISRRSRFYSGTRYKKRGINGSGHVANDIETEQILYDWNVTRSISSFVLIRGSTPIFWSQDPNETIIKKPPIFYTQNDPTNSSSREHFKELMGYYGSPIVVLNLLLDNPSTDEGQLSLRYQQMIEQLNNELPSHLKIHYFSKNIKSLLERGVAKQMLKEVVDMVHNKVRLTFLPTYPFNEFNKSSIGNMTGVSNICNFTNLSHISNLFHLSNIGNVSNFRNVNGFNNSNYGDGFSSIKDFSDLTNFVYSKYFNTVRDNMNSKNTTSTNGFVDGTNYKCMIVQNGIIRISCLDCLDRTSAFAKHMSLSMFRHQLELIGINVNYERSVMEVPGYFANPGSPVSVRSNKSPSSSINYDMESVENYNIKNTNNNTNNTNTDTNKNNIEYNRYNKDKTKMQNINNSKTNVVGDMSYRDKQNKDNTNEDEETERENITISDYYGFNHVRGLLFEVLKEKYEKMCDVLSMQYAGSNALKKYEGQSKAISISRELFTTVRRRYRNFFEDAKIQEQTNAFLCSSSISKYSELGVDISQTDLDPYIHFQPITMQFSNVESFLISLAVNSSRSSCLLNNNNIIMALDNKNNNEDEENKKIREKERKENKNNTKKENKDKDGKRKHKEIKEHEHEDCQLYKDILDKERSFYKITRNYLTIEDPIEEEYTNLVKYKPTHKLIKIVNMVSKTDSSERIQFFRKFGSIQITNMNSNEECRGENKETKEMIPLKIKNNREDYSRYLVPEYTYNPENWTLITRSNVEILNRYIHIVT